MTTQDDKELLELLAIGLDFCVWHTERARGQHWMESHNPVINSTVLANLWRAAVEVHGENKKQRIERGS